MERITWVIFKMEPASVSILHSLCWPDHTADFAPPSIRRLLLRCLTRVTSQTDAKFQPDLLKGLPRSSLCRSAPTAISWGESVKIFDLVNLDLRTFLKAFHSGSCHLSGQISAGQPGRPACRNHLWKQVCPHLTWLSTARFMRGSPLSLSLQVSTDSHRVFRQLRYND
jgi:hypothetical protein